MYRFNSQVFQIVIYTYYKAQARLLDSNPQNLEWLEIWFGTISLGILFFDLP